ncbi:tautomerase family protein [Bacillus sp. PK3_68]|uniref:tautomerase family protein n=1 Tax=Bacillus sp. PK3_68 TaxID=2027408 RepID=UPI000E70A2EB|nr:tautomerase family protein [Bacillus sp. PK3_68]RJS50298.1 hypothetical protein CJ483_23045 [Bacillus sp. PK3_68]
MDENLSVTIYHAHEKHGISGKGKKEMEGTDLPIITIEMLDGRTDEMQLTLIQEVTDAVSHTLNIDKEEIDIILHEVKRKHWAKGGILWPWGRSY